jgi:hypothetical protein
VIFSKRSRRSDAINMVCFVAPLEVFRVLFIKRRAEIYLSLAVASAASEFTLCQRYAKLTASIASVR